MVRGARGDGPSCTALVTSDTRLNRAEECWVKKLFSPWIGRTEDRSTLLDRGEASEEKRTDESEEYGSEQVSPGRRLAGR